MGRRSEEKGGRGGGRRKGKVAGLGRDKSEL